MKVIMWKKIPNLYDKKKVPSKSWENLWSWGANLTRFRWLSCFYRIKSPLSSFFGYGQVYLLSWSTLAHIRMREVDLWQLLLSSMMLHPFWLDWILWNLSLSIKFVPTLSAQLLAFRYARHLWSGIMHLCSIFLQDTFDIYILYLFPSIICRYGFYGRLNACLSFLL